MQQRHEVRRETLNGPCAEKAVESGELARPAKVLECERVISATHPLARRLIIAPSDYMAEDDFHCTSSSKLLSPIREQNRGLNDKVSKYFAGCF